MPVTPTEARNRRNADSKPSINVICERIDKYLSREEPNDQGQWWYAIIGVTHEARQQLVAIYRALNWKVEIIHDQIHGDALVFEEL